MKKTINKLIGISAIFSLLVFGINTQAAVTLYTTTFDEGNGNVLDKDNQAVRDDSLWQAAIDSGWSHGSGNSWVFNSATGSPSGNDGVSPEGPLLKMIDLSATAVTTENALNISFNYSAWGALPGSGVDDLYIHVWGFTDVNSTASTVVADLVSQEGNSWGALTPSEYDDFTRYNLKDASVLAAGNSSTAGSQAITMNNISLSINNDGTQANASFLLTSTGYLSNYDYLAVSFTRNVADDSGEAFAIRDFTIEGIQQAPEPSSLALLFIGGALLMSRNRKKLS